MRYAAAMLGVVLAVSASQGAVPTMRAFMDANCKAMTDACTKPIVAALDAAAASGKIPAKCAAGRPPKAPMALDIALWQISHHDLDAKPMPEAVVTTAERLWPCAKAM